MNQDIDLYGKEFFEKVRYYSRALLIYSKAWAKRRLAVKTIFIGITGSVGKTTTKEACATILSQFAACGSTQQSHNRHLSIAADLAGSSRTQRYFVAEMSASKPNFLNRSIWLVKPSVGVLTNIGRDHYKQFKSLEGIAQEKSKLIHRLPAGGVAVLNMDDPYVKAIGEACTHKKVWVGRNENATIRLLETHSRWPEPLALTVLYQGTAYRVTTSLYGEHMALAVLCALGVAVALNLSLEKAIRAVEQLRPAEGRMQLVEHGDGVTFIRDDWKAPEWSLEAPLEFLKKARSGRKIAVVGTLSDFSTDSSKKYRQIARKVQKVADLTVFVGPNALRALRAREHPDDPSLQGFEHIIDAARFLKQELRSGDLVLLKGSAKTDHLVRLLYDRYKPVKCWEDRCGKEVFCGYCPRVYQA